MSWQKRMRMVSEPITDYITTFRGIADIPRTQYVEEDVWIDDEPGIRPNGLIRVPQEQQEMPQQYGMPFEFRSVIDEDISFQLKELRRRDLYRYLSEMISSPKTIKKKEYKGWTNTEDK